MSARLNDDVLLLILDELANQGKGAHARPSRSGILASVCLVSRRFSRLARPRLWQHVEVSQGGQLAGLKATTGALGSCAVSYTVRWSWTANAVLADLVDVARWLPCVLDLRIHGCWTQLPSLSSIESHTCEFLSAPFASCSLTQGSTTHRPPSPHPRRLQAPRPLREPRRPSSPRTTQHLQRLRPSLLPLPMAPAPQPPPAARPAPHRLRRRLVPRRLPPPRHPLSVPPGPARLCPDRRVRPRAGRGPRARLGPSVYLRSRRVRARCAAHATATHAPPVEE